MKKSLLLLIILTTAVLGQNFSAEKITGNVKVISGDSDKWQQLTTKTILDENAVVTTEKKSSVLIKSEEISFLLKESSAVTVSNIKKMSLDELVLALAMEDVMNTPRKNGTEKSGNTGVYGNKVNEKEITTLNSNDFGFKRLNGAKQLAESGLKESAIITAKEVYRKYPDTKQDIVTRIYFADLLFESGLYEEAYQDYTEIKMLTLTDEQKKYVDEKLDQISRKLIKK